MKDECFGDDLLSVLNNFSKKSNFQCIKSVYTPESFGNAYLILAGSDFDILVTRDRGQIQLKIGPRDYGSAYSRNLEKLKTNPTTNVLEWQKLSENWRPLEIVAEFLSLLPKEGNNLPQAIVSMSQIIRILEDNYDLISEFIRTKAFSDEFLNFARKRNIW